MLETWHARAGVIGECGVNIGDDYVWFGPALSKNVAPWRNDQ
jgi:hypothetical protein